MTEEPDPTSQTAASSVDAPTADPRASRRRWYVVGAAALVVGVVVGGAAWAQAAQASAAEERRQTLTAQAESDLAAVETSAADLDERAGAAAARMDGLMAEYAAGPALIQSLVAASPALFSSESAAALATAVQHFDVVAGSLRDPADPALWDLVRAEGLPFTADELIGLYLDDTRRATAEGDVQTAVDAQTADAADDEAQADLLQAAMDDVTAAVAAVAASAPAMKDVYASASAWQASPDVLAQLANAVGAVGTIGNGSFVESEGATRVLAFQAYIDAAAAAVASHTAVVAAQQAGTVGTDAAGSVGPGVSGGFWPGPPPTGSLLPPGWVGTTQPWTTQPSNPSYPERPPGSRGSVYFGAKECEDGEGSGEASTFWTADLSAPFDAPTITVWEDPGNMWGLTWSCT